MSGDRVLPRTKSCRTVARAILLSSLFPHTREAASASWKARVLPTEAPSRCLCMLCVCVCSCQLVGACRLAGCNPDYIIYCFVRFSFLVVSSPWFCVRGSIVLSCRSSFCSVIPRFRAPVVPPWFLLRVQINTTPVYAPIRPNRSVQTDPVLGLCSRSRQCWACISTKAFLASNMLSIFFHNTFAFVSPSKLLYRLVSMKHRIYAVVFKCMASQVDVPTFLGLSISHCTGDHKSFHNYMFLILDLHT